MLSKNEASAGSSSEIEPDRNRPDHDTNLRAAGLTALAVSLFAVSDAVVKLLAVAYPPGQILFYRSVLASLFLAAIVRLRGAGRSRLPLDDRAAWLRAAVRVRGHLVLLSRLAAAAARRGHGRALRLPAAADRLRRWC